MLTYEKLNLGKKSHLKAVKEILEDPDQQKEWKHTFHYFNLPLKDVKEAKEGIENEWIIKKEEEVIGWLKKSLVDDGISLITDINYIILPSKRKQGYATELLKEQEQFAFLNDIDEIHLVVGKENIPNRTLLEKMGYQYKQTSINQPCIRYYKKNPNIERKKKK